MNRLAVVIASPIAFAIGGALLSAPVGAASNISTTRTDSDQRAARVLCNGKEATIVGNRRSNKLYGTPRRDIIAGVGGGDVIIGRGGNDLICGGAGGDIVAGLQGSDRLYGGRQKDQCFGEHREHPYHFGCEVHRNPLGAPVNDPRDPSRASDMSTSRATLVKDTGRLALRGTATSDRPYCQTGNINLGRFYFVSGPGQWIAVRPVYSLWNDFTGGYGGDAAATDWQYYSAPNDGQYYQVNMGSFDISAQSIWGYQVYWWNGAEWVDGTLVGIPRYDNAGASAAFTYTLGSCVT